MPPASPLLPKLDSITSQYLRVKIESNRISIIHQKFSF